MCARARARVRVCVFVLHALNFPNMYIYRMCKHLGPVQGRRSKYSSFLLSVSLLAIPAAQDQQKIASSCPLFS